MITSTTTTTTGRAPNGHLAGAQRAPSPASGTSPAAVPSPLGPLGATELLLDPTPDGAPALGFAAPEAAWRQSALRTWLACGLSYRLLHVERAVPAVGFAGGVGTALHAAMAAGLAAREASRDAGGAPTAPPLGVDDLRGVALEALDGRVQEDVARGAALDPEALQAALASLEDGLALVALALSDPRLFAIRWRGLEAPWSLRDAHGRRWRGTIDGHGVAAHARGEVDLGPGALGPLLPGDVVVADWKTGEDHPGALALAKDVQLWLYRSAVRTRWPGARVRVFQGRTRDLERPTRPRDETGAGIPATLRRENPAWRALVDGGASTAKASRAAPKWIEEPNPAHAAAAARPRGPFLHEAELDDRAIAATIADVVDAVRAGMFPAQGAVHGACPRCDVRAACARGGVR